MPLTSKGESTTASVAAGAAAGLLGSDWAAKASGARSAAAKRKGRGVVMAEAANGGVGGGVARGGRRAARAGEATP